MTENIYYSGTVTRVLKHGRSGFITTLLGEDVFFNRDSFPEGAVNTLEEGNIVTFRANVKFDETKGRDNFVASEIEKI